MADYHANSLLRIGMDTGNNGSVYYYNQKSYRVQQYSADMLVYSFITSLTTIRYICSLAFNFQVAFRGTRAIMEVCFLLLVHTHDSISERES